ncbi:MAG: hypothetical protein JJ899_00805 [Alphaproteobacteria bacterium]|nr:hypothetical protein [Alphaproteobacteria bacterium]
MSGGFGLRNLGAGFALCILLGVLLAAPVSAQVLFGREAPPAENQVPVVLSNGDSATFRSRNHINFMASGEVGIFLIYRTDDMPSEASDIPAVENRLFANTREICAGPAQEHIDFMFGAFPDADFTVLAVRLQKGVAEKDGLEQVLNWTGVFRIADGKCGEPIYTPKDTAN